jgi:tetratricopeptide (TPR) repeat protein
MRPRATAFLFIALLAGTSTAFAAVTVTFEAPLLDRNDRALSQLVDGILLDAQAVLPTVSGDLLVPAAGAPAARYTLATIASSSSGTLNLIATLKRVSDGVTSDLILWAGRPVDALPLYLARSIVARWRFLESGAVPTSPAPVLVDEVSTTTLDPARPWLSPWNFALRDDGTLVAALGPACLELDAAFRVVAEPGRSLVDRGIANFAGGVSLSMAGTVVLRPLQGRDLYRIPLGSTEAQKVPAGLDVMSARVSSQPDGALLVIDPAKARVVQIRDGAQKSIPLELDPSLFWQASTVAPDGTLWYWDPVIRGFRIYSGDCVLADFLIPLVDPPGSLAPMSFVVTADGGVITASKGILQRFHRDGSPVWSLASLPGAEVESLPDVPTVAFDEERGLLYVGDTIRQRIIKLLDRGSGQPSAADPFAEQLAALRKSMTPGSVAFLAARARLYDTAGSTAVAKAGWQSVLDQAPNDTEAARRLDALELAELRAAGDALAAKAIETLRSVGVENARSFYQQAIAKYELVLARSPEDAEAKRATRVLKDLFADPSALKPPITILEAKLDALFPYLMLRYREQGVGTITVKNTGSSALTGIVASAVARGHDDAPLEAEPVARLEPGATATIGLRLAFGDWVLENDEDRPLAIQVDVTAAGVSTPVVKTVSTTLNRRTALTWDDTGRIAAFITPNELVVDAFAAAAASAGTGLRWRTGTVLPRAIRILEAIGAHGIAYVEDPAAPISKVFGSATTIDTVRFARDTLLRRTGDCDDTTVLAASALESQGIATAVLTTPGHIFIAFDSGESAESMSLFAAGGLEAIARDGTAWIPVETTVLKEGFAVAWKTASALVRAHRGGDFEFLPVRSLRERWLPLPLRTSMIVAAAPPAGIVESRVEASLVGVEKLAYAVRLAELETAAKGLSGRQELRVRMRQGILHAMYGKVADAEKVFRAAQAKDPAMVSPWVNLASLQMAGGDLEAAIATLRAGLPKVEDASQLTFALVRCYTAKGDAKNAALYLAETRRTSPQLAELLAAGAEPGGSSGRGAAGGGSVPPRWSMDD